MKTQMQNLKDRKGESGNVLFLILIAVALFAALSYAVTQSTRSGSGDASSEKSLVSSAALTQYPASLKTAITRMIITNGVDVNNMTFEPPSNFSAYTDTGAATNYSKNGVFHPTGGGATYMQAPADSMANGLAGTWHFNGENEVKNIGTSAPSTTVTAGTADIIAFLPGISRGVCEKINKNLGIVDNTSGAAVIPDLSSTGVDTTTDITVAAPGIGFGGKVITDTKLDGLPQGCFQSGASEFTYYHVIVER